MREEGGGRKRRKACLKKHKTKLFFFFFFKILFLDAELQRKEKEILKRNLAQKRNRSPPKWKRGKLYGSRKSKVVKLERMNLKTSFGTLS